MGERIKIKINPDECKHLVNVLMVISIDMFADKIKTKAVISILQELVRKLQLSSFNNRSINQLKVHEAWALFEGLQNIELDPNESAYEFNLVTKITNTIHQQLS